MSIGNEVKGLRARTSLLSLRVKAHVHGSGLEGKAQLSYH